jgi:tetraacyldisaccharide-1-P 4'-kinase
VAGFSRRLVLETAVGDPDRWAALSGVARPERFETDAAAALGRPAVLAVRCEDHAAYGAGARARIESALRAAGRPLTVTTEKDWTKLAARWPEDLPVRVARQELVWTGTKALPALVGERLSRRREGEV